MRVYLKGQLILIPHLITASPYTRPSFSPEADSFPLVTRCPLFSLETSSIDQLSIFVSLDQFPKTD